MVRQCFLLKTGILFHREMFKVMGMDPDTLYPTVRPRPPPVTRLSVVPRPHRRAIPSTGTSRTLVDVSDFISEEEEDLADALSPINDMLKIAKSWWILEVIPQKFRFQQDDDSWTQQLLYVVFLLNRGESDDGRPLSELTGEEVERYPDSTRAASKCTGL